MNYQISLFKNTGFNSINIPGSQALIDSCPQITLSSNDAQCDILQARGLTSLPLRVSYDDAKMVDYIRLSNATEKVYYAVKVVPEKSSPDVTTFSLEYDPINSNVSNVSQLKFLDGIFERHHTSTDGLFEYVEEDPYLIPSKPLGIHYESAFLGKASTSEDSIIIAEATVPLDEIGDTTVTPDATAYTTSGGSECVVPKLPKLTAHSAATMPRYPSDVSNPQVTLLPSTGYFDTTYTNIQEGLARVRDLGIENGSIVAQYIVPKEYAAAEHYSSAHTGEILNLHGKKDININLSNDFKFEYGTAHNKRVYAGICNKYGLLAIGSGNSAEFNPEDIYGTNNVKPSVSVISDPRPNGKPYFRYSLYKNDDVNFFMNCVAGLNWQNVPLLYTDKSGSEIDTIRFQTEQSIKDQNAVVSGAQTFLGGGAGSSPRGFVGGVLHGIAQNGLAMGIMAAEAFTGQKAYDDATYSAISPVYDIARLRANSANQELQEFNISQNIVAPQLMFPRSEGLRDFLGNGCYAYRYYLENSDIAKFDKILTMFGYRDTQPAPGNESFLTNRPRFNYCKIAGASVGGTLPQWEREAISAVFSVGVRIWHTLPNTAYYTDGSNDLT